MKALGKCIMGTCTLNVLSTVWILPVMKRQPPARQQLSSQGVGLDQLKTNVQESKPCFGYDCFLGDEKNCPQPVRAVQCQFSLASACMFLVPLPASFLGQI